MNKRDLRQRLDELFTSPGEPAPSRDEGAPPPDAGEHAALLAQIAELKQAQAELQASERKFRDLVENATFRDVTERQEVEAALSRRALQLQTAADISRAASSILNADELLASTVDLIRERFNLYYVGLFLVDEARQSAVLRAGTGEAGRTMIERGHSLAVGGASMVGWCVANRHARIALDVGQDATRFDNSLLPETRSELALPLIARSEVLGAMTVHSTQAEAFSEIDIAVLQTMTDQVANAIANARLFEQARRQLAELSAVSAISRALTSGLGLNSLIELTVDTIRETFAVNNAYIAIYDSRTHTVRIPYMVEDNQKLPIEPFPLGQGLTSAIIRSRQPLWINQDVERRMAELGARHAGAPAKSFLGVPIIVGDEVIGTLCIQDTQRSDLFGEDELRLLTNIAPGVGIAIQNARLFEQTQAALTESRRLARRAMLVNRISGKIRAAVSVDDVLHLAADELRQATRATYARARLDAPGRANGDSSPHGAVHE